MAGLTKAVGCDLLPVLQPKSGFLPEVGCGGTEFRSDSDGANKAGQPVARPLSRPSPSANLVGNWKGDPLEPPVGGLHVPQNKTQNKVMNVFRLVKNMVIGRARNLLDASLSDKTVTHGVAGVGRPRRGRFVFLMLRPGGGVPGAEKPHFLSLFVAAAYDVDDRRHLRQLFADHRVVSDAAAAAIWSPANCYRQRPAWFPAAR